MHRRVPSPLPLLHQLHARVAPVVPIWVQMSGLASGRTTTFVHPVPTFCAVALTFLTLQKEVERRRRGNINEGINELGRIVPNGSGEKAKGAILSRAVQYIHHLKENEARNIEKWTLEKLLMDQAMGDLQAQLEEMRRLWEEERAARTRAESELDVLRGLKGSSGTSAADGHAVSASAGAAAEKASEASAPAAAAAAATSASDGETTQGGEEENSRPGKRQRTD
jgi:hypothetical protein